MLSDEENQTLRETVSALSKKNEQEKGRMEEALKDIVWDQNGAPLPLADLFFALAFLT